MKCKQFVLILIIELIAFCCDCGCLKLKNKIHTIVICNKTDKQNEIVKINSEFIIQIDGNITTGFMWFLDSMNGNSLQDLNEKNDKFQLINGKYTENKHEEGLVGSPGVFEFKFKATSLGTTVLNFSYKRVWENTKPINTKELTVEVK